MTPHQPAIPPQPLRRPLLAGGIALVIGALVDILAYRHPAGFGLMVAALIVIAVIAFAPWWAHRPAPSRWILGSATVAALFLGVRSSPTLTGLNLMLLAVTGTIAVHQLGGSRVRDWAVSDYLRNAVATLLTIGSEALAFATTDLRPMRTRFDGGRAMPVVLGLALGIPLVLLFGGLFASADAAFANILNDLFFFDFEFASFFSHVVATIVTAAAVVGVWRFGLTQTNRTPDQPGSGLSLDRGSAATALGLLVALFTVFVAVQITYLFGGVDALERTGLSYSEYTRRGFFELVAVAALVLAVVLAIDWATHRVSEQRARTVDALALALIGLTFVILASAAYRMGLYTSALGLTELRLYTSAFMGWVGVVLAWAVATVFRGRRHHFALGAFGAGVVLIVGLNVANPDAVIARANLHNSSVELDAAYLSQLSEDAIPTITAYIESADPDCAARQELLVSTDRRSEGDWRSTTLADLRASRALDRLTACNS